jgi:phosphatidylserine/phosphatidylglycerophosphate/cardiolipin synthase-like enzyme
VLKVRKSSYKAAEKAALFFSGSPFKLFTLFLTILISLYLGITTQKKLLPSQKHPLLVYTNLTTNLKKLYLQAINSATCSIDLWIYGLTDEDIIFALKKKIWEGVEVKIFYDPTGSKKLSQDIPMGYSIPIPTSGLMHKKVLCIDHKMILMGSANLTETSLRLHDNLVLGIYNKELCSYLMHSIDSMHECNIDGQNIEIWTLPDHNKRCLNHLIEQLKSAQKTIQICMFTLTNQQIINALIEAKKSGINVEVILDYYTAKGASKRAVSKLSEEYIQVEVSRPGKLLHHKFCFIDEKKLIFGSTNWTGSAFIKNDDNMIIIRDLSKKQINDIKKTWHTIREQSSTPSIED